jgi:hypothetical protein
MKRKDMMTKNNPPTAIQTETREYGVDHAKSVDKSEMTLEHLVETEMIQMGLDPRDENDRARFWSEKGLMG